MKKVAIVGVVTPKDVRTEENGNFQPLPNYTEFCTVVIVSFDRKVK